MHAHSSSSTPAAYEKPRDSVEWVQFSDDVTSKTCCWNRRTRQSVWKPPAGIKVVWVGTQDEEGVRCCWHKVTRVGACALPPLPPGLMGVGVRSLASFHPIMGAIAWTFSSSPSVLAVSCTISWCSLAPQRIPVLAPVHGA